MYESVFFIPALQKCTKGETHAHFCINLHSKVSTLYIPSQRKYILYIWFNLEGACRWTLFLYIFQSLVDELLWNCACECRCQRSRPSVCWWRSCMTTASELCTETTLRIFTASFTSWSDWCRFTAFCSPMFAVYYGRIIPRPRGMQASPPHWNPICYDRLGVLSVRLLISTANYYYTSSSSPSEPGRLQVLGKHGPLKLIALCLI